jgi:hypothetical protein
MAPLVPARIMFQRTRGQRLTNSVASREVPWRLRESTSPAPREIRRWAQPGAKILITDGPYLETKEHIGGFWVLEATDMNEALEWGRNAVVACRAPVEVRQFHSL